MSPLESLQGEDGWSARRWLYWLLVLLALGSVATGVRNALERSQDFQWSGERVLLAHVDPWAVYLAGDPGHQFVQTQIPNYLAILYVLIVPLGWLSQEHAKLAWALGNVVLALLSALFAARSYRLNWRGVGVVTCLFLMATPTRSSIGNGQQGLLVLATWSATLLASRMSVLRAGWAGVGYLKFSFAPPGLLFLLIRWGPKRALASLVPAVAAVGVVWLWITGGRDLAELARLMIEPFAVARTGFKANAGDPNLMNLVEPLLRRAVSPDVAAGLALGLALAVCLAVSWAAFRRRAAGTVPWQMALVALLSLGLFKHHAYDGVVLLLPLCYALARWQQPGARIVLAGLAYLFYGQRLLEAAQLHPLWLRVPEFALLMGMLGATYWLGKDVQEAEPRLGIHAVTKDESRAA